MKENKLISKLRKILDDKYLRVILPISLLIFLTTSIGLVIAGHFITLIGNLIIVAVGIITLVFIIKDL